ncbi:MAG: hypothetical protein IJU50_01790, partial [Lachnospiraceae bacterium]|nr:hypothetical protein [Lachnospiraceae bacterium]
LRPWFFCFFLLPPSFAFFYLMSPEDNVSTLMYYQYCLLFIFLLPLAEIAAGRKEQLFAGNSIPAVPSSQTIAESFSNTHKRVSFLEKCFLPWAFVLLFLLSFRNYVLCNEAYLRMDLAKGAVCAYYERLISALEQAEGYEYEEPAVILGNYWADAHPAPIGSFDMQDERFRDFSGIATEYGLLTAGVRERFIKTYLGFSLNSPRSHQIEESEEYAEMPPYPISGSIKKIGKVWVIKISEQ